MNERRKRPGPGPGEAVDSAGEWGLELVPRLGPAVADYPPGSSFGPRTARSHEFVWLLRGSATWTCGALRVPLRPGALLLVRPGMRDALRFDPARPTRHAYVHFRLTGPAAPGREEAAGWPVVKELARREEPMAALCRYLLHLGGARPPSWERHAAHTLRLLLLTFVAGPLPADPPAAALPEPVLAMMAEVGACWADGVARPVPLGRLAAAAGVSVSTLCRTFRARFGLGPVAALERLRLARAEPLLWLSNLPLRAVALQCGFADAYHFSRRFRAVYGVAPSAFRATPPESAAPSPLAAAGLGALEALLPPAGALGGERGKPAAP
ncbi:AraC family transcriptional regulator [Streptomyces hoynatensis]|uniref:AraC family transcriptional regulator n=1 Tax=Streptomyces hoynatensis TaxID=1141874 RepID=A0A3A9YY70_9ACTN|nr:AraC family transcriptional regulator [Streptomyces hoynatensis]RKN40840.1 AraC family transcriptional regulator [Streptomyces hoynatensis]